MQRYFVDPEMFCGSTALISGDDARHLQTVMRAKAGDMVIVSDGRGREAEARIFAFGSNGVEVELGPVRVCAAEPCVEVWIAQGLPKGDKMEIVIQKGTEAGAAGFVPFVSERTVVRYDDRKEAKRNGRWAKIAKEAAEQAQRGRIPPVMPVSDWRGVLEFCKRADAAFICYEREGELKFRQLLKELFGRGREPGRILRLALVVGPEGGFAEREIAEAEAAGLVPVSLGRRVLRTETAALVALSCIMYESGEMGG